MMQADYLIVGGGAAGMAAAVALVGQGGKVVLAERSDTLGGVLNQCAHKGFGLGYFGQDMTGMEYGERYIEKLRQLPENQLTVLCSTAVMDIGQDRTAVLQNEKGRETIAFKKLILASGARERTINSLCVSGTRPSGVMTAGMAQRFINIHDLDVGEDIIILGTGDIGQVVARDLINRGKKVKLMIEKASSLGGLVRNQNNCIKANNIPVMLNSEIVRIFGKDRIEAVEVIHNDSKETEIVKCSTLLTAIGLIPETDLLEDSFGKEIPEWVIKCGNCNHIHDIVDSVTMEAERIKID